MIIPKTCPVCQSVLTNKSNKFMECSNVKLVNYHLISFSHPQDNNYEDLYITYKDHTFYWDVRNKSFEFESEIISYVEPNLNDSNTFISQLETLINFS